MQPCVLRMVRMTLNLSVLHLWEGRGQTNFSLRAHPLVYSDKMKPLRHVSLLFLPRFLIFVWAFNTLLSFHFPLSLSGKKKSQYEHNKETQTIHQNLSPKNGVKRKKNSPFVFIFFMVEFLWQAVLYVGVLCLCQHKRLYPRLQREVKVNGFPTDKISHFSLLVSFHFCHCVLLCLIVNNMVFVSCRCMLHLT